MTFQKLQTHISAVSPDQNSRRCARSLPVGKRPWTDESIAASTCATTAARVERFSRLSRTAAPQPCASKASSAHGTKTASTLLNSSAARTADRRWCSMLEIASTELRKS
eukprot:2765356-Rhodomonas_salina.1